jgi:phosphoglycolate phosphatase-like HAD superfamily hydrolase
LRALSKYATWVFDCDGVLLNSNKVKSDAFYQTALPYGKGAASKLLAFHIENGGISRFEKFNYFFSEILSEKNYEQSLASALDTFSLYCNQGIIECEMSPNLIVLLNRLRTLGKKVFVVSGGHQEELRSIFSTRKLDILFEGIFGSPDDKVKILNREISSREIILPAIFFGDSRYDFEAAHRCGLDFIFVSDWTEFEEWPEFCADKNIRSITRLDDLLMNSLI